MKVTEFTVVGSEDGGKRPQATQCRRPPEPEQSSADSQPGNGDFSLSPARSWILPRMNLREQETGSPQELPERTAALPAPGGEPREPCPTPDPHTETETWGGVKLLSLW